MVYKKILILDGSGEEDNGLSNILAQIVDELNREGLHIQVIPLREKMLGACTGCYGCWLKTPGLCVQRDEGTQIARLVMQSDILMFFSPLVFGGYTPLLKRIIDRIFSSLNLPFMELKNGETHHIPRYPHYPRLIGVGVQSQPDNEEAEIYRLLLARNSLNLHASSFAAEVLTLQDTPDQIRQKLHSLLNSKDPLPKWSYPGLETPDRNPVTSLSRHVLLVNGSPKGCHPTTSASLGRFLVKQLNSNGWESEEISLKANIYREKGEVDLIKAFEWSDLVVLTAPIYNDSLPTYLIEGLIKIKNYQSKQTQSVQKQFMVIFNNGFPELHHNIPALQICRQFALKSGLNWLGWLALPAGEALCDGKALGDITRMIPSVKHVKKALGWTADSLTKGDPIPEYAIRTIAKTPVPLSTFGLWRQIFLKVAARRWVTKAEVYGVSRDQIYTMPFVR